MRSLICRENAFLSCPPFPNRHGEGAETLTDRMNSVSRPQARPDETLRDCKHY